jgi:hypothetical protein
MRLPSIVCLTLLWLTLPGCHQSRESIANQPAPNVIFILADDLGSNDLSSFRTENDSLPEQTPTVQTLHLDALATRGMRKNLIN